LGLLEDLERRLAGVEDKLNGYAVHIVTDDKRHSRLAERLFHSPSRSELFLGFLLGTFVCILLHCFLRVVVIVFLSPLHAVQCIVSAWGFVTGSLFCCFVFSFYFECFYSDAFLFQLS
jgi:hypothetical protein